MEHAEWILENSKETLTDVTPLPSLWSFCHFFGFFSFKPIPVHVSHYEWRERGQGGGRPQTVVGNLDDCWRILRRISDLSVFCSGLFLFWTKKADFIQDLHRNLPNLFLFAFSIIFRFSEFGFLFKFKHRYFQPFKKTDSFSLYPLSVVL